MIPTAVFCPIKTGPDTPLARVKSGTFSSQSIEAPPASIAINISAVTPTALIFKEEYKTVCNAVELYKPDVAVVDYTFFAGRCAVMNLNVPFFCNVAFSPLSIIREQTWAAAWKYPQTGTGYSMEMSIATKLRNFYYIVGQTLVGAYCIGTLAYQVSKDSALRFRDMSNSAIFQHSRGVFINTILDFEYPVAKNDHIIPTGPLISTFDNTNFDPWLNDHETIVFIGLGTITKLDKAAVEQYLAVFKIVSRKFPECAFLFKTNNALADHQALPTVPENIRIVNYLPSQLAVLNHPHIKVFVSHCGGNGVHEGLYFGKPILGVPKWSDCYDFAQRIQDFGVGLRVFKTFPTIDVDEVATKMVRLLTERRFTEVAMKMMFKMRSFGLKVAVDAILNEFHEE
ncbi:hypothetical protein HK100_004654 [Physocladia obscura]|uniref:Glycosyltransferase n=1 Tax=Physocladia obscura TaxID=109957 RepID=A0AAD5T650_9FUNG|nr:hypothetical protein HK100_004654 [Physocladia obscura]